MKIKSKYPFSTDRETLDQKKKKKNTGIKKKKKKNIFDEKKKKKKKKAKTLRTTAEKIVPQTRCGDVENTSTSNVENFLRRMRGKCKQVE